MVAKRNASAARLALGFVFELITLLPVTRLSRLSPNQEAKWPALSHFVISVPNLTDDFQHCEPVHAVDTGQVHPRHPVQVALDIEAGRVSPIALFAIGSRRRAIAAVLNRSSWV